MDSKELSSVDCIEDGADSRKKEASNNIPYIEIDEAFM
ncbi:hypothetical protein COLO4_08142 [Corchorus olitorius]|uniref:Uncharacterized protein n=1 Tax=Corchorus olitorius TaxID=93759 RepID=A0A1R3KH47_9ROSI|nr:hypothetical protein COLO4_08142 [Corchorus olitorius]